MCRAIFMFKGMTDFVCPNCGGDVPQKAKACPHCGADEETGWSVKTEMDGLDIYDETDYQDTLKKEFGGGGTPKMEPKQMVIAAVGALLLIAFLLNYVF